MKPLSKGDTCRVRLHTGEVVEAVYKDSSKDCKHHYLDFNGDEIILVKRKTMHDWECRLVGNPCDLVPVGGE